jgi:hypothetical protein
MEIVLPIIAFIFSTFSFVALIIILNKSAKLKHPLTFGILIAILHFMIVVLLDIVIKISVKEYPDTNFLWMLVTFIDLPVVLILITLGFYLIPILCSAYLVPCNIFP